MVKGNKKMLKNSDQYSIQFFPSLEFIAAADSAGPRTVKSAIMNKNEGINPWRNSFKSDISPFELSDLDLIFSPVSTVIFLFYIIIQDEIIEVEELIDRLDSMSEKIFLDRFKQFLHVDPGEVDWINADFLEQALAADRARENVSYRMEAENLVSLLSSAVIFQRKIVEVLTWFNKKVFGRMFNSADVLVENWIKRNQPVLENDLKGNLDQLTNDSYDSVLSMASAIKLFPISDSANSDIWILFPDEVFIIFSISYADEKMAAHPESVQERYLTDQAIDALSDSKRIAMLRLIRKRPFYSKELADTLGITASTASYHIEKLVSAKLAKLQISNGRRFYYSINTKGFQKLLQCIEKEFVEDSRLE